MYKYSRTLAFLLLILAGNQANAILIGGDDITASTSLSPLGTFTIDQISDGITSNFPFNGFASHATSGVISLVFSQLYDLDSFVLWNDINVLFEGVKNFRLDFFDNSDNNLGSESFTAQGGLVDPQLFSFNTILGVSKADFVVLDVLQGGFANRIEVREVAFNGSISVPESSTLALLAIALLLVIAVAGKNGFRGKQ